MTTGKSGIAGTACKAKPRGFRRARQCELGWWRAVAFEPLLRLLKPVNSYQAWKMLELKELMVYL